MQLSQLPFDRILAVACFMTEYKRDKLLKKNITPWQTCLDLKESAAAEPDGFDIADLTEVH
jgi:hypothetical protein